MLSMKSLIRFVDKGFLLKLLLTLMTVSLVLIGEIIFLFFVQQRIGAYLTLAIVAGTGLLGLVISYQNITAILRIMRDRIDDGTYPLSEFTDLAGALVGSVLLLLPGFVTDVIGVLVFLPVFRRLVGGFITRRMADTLKELYEYLKLYDL